MISGYSLTEENCTSCEPSQPENKVSCTARQVARWCESISILLNLDVRSQTPESALPHHSAALQNMSVSPLFCTHGIDYLVFKRKDVGKTTEMARKDRRVLI